MLAICPSIHRSSHPQDLLCTTPCVRTNRGLGSKQSSLLPLRTCTWKARWTHEHTHTRTHTHTHTHTEQPGFQAGHTRAEGIQEREPWPGSGFGGGGIELSALKASRSSASFAEQVRTGPSQPSSPCGSPPRSHRILGKFRLSFASAHRGCEAQMGMKNVPRGTWPVEPCLWI